MLPIKTISAVLKVLTYIIIIIADRPIRLALTPMEMSVSTFKTADILYVEGKIF
jgi:hypothetical protein